MLLNSKLISWESYITTKLRTGYYNKSQVYIMDEAKLETQTNLYLNTTAKLVPENNSFQFKPKALESLEDFNEVEELNPCFAGTSTS